MKLAAFALVAVTLRSCDPAVGGGPRSLIEGTWGGDNAGLIAGDTSAHVHIGCTLGDTKGAIVPGPGGAFDVSGSYNITAYPIYRGPDHPARFTGTVTGNVMTLTVTLTDTAYALGPVQLFFGKEPRMGPYPICRVPGERMKEKTSHDLGRLQ